MNADCSPAADDAVFATPGLRPRPWTQRRDLDKRATPDQRSLVCQIARYVPPRAARRANTASAPASLCRWCPPAEPRLRNGDIDLPRIYTDERGLVSGPGRRGVRDARPSARVTDVARDLKTSDRMISRRSFSRSPAASRRAQRGARTVS